MTEREIILTGAAVELKLQADALYNAVNNKEGYYKPVLVKISSVYIDINYATNYIITPEMKAKYLTPKQG